MSVSQEMPNHYFVVPEHNGDSRPAKEQFSLGSRVNVTAGYSKNIGEVCGLDDQFPHKAQVKLMHGLGSSTCWIKVEHLSLTNDPRPAKERFSVGTSVRVQKFDLDGVSTEGRGKVVKLSNKLPFKAKVQFTLKSNTSRLDWINISLRDR